ncbi:MAG TPA: hypothetical protein VGL06_29895 [Pseudonocardiaceae bacterium]
MGAAVAIRVIRRLYPRCSSGFREQESEFVNERRGGDGLVLGQGAGVGFEGVAMLAELVTTSARVARPGQLREPTQAEVQSLKRLAHTTGEAMPTLSPPDTIFQSVSSGIVPTAP